MKKFITCFAVALIAGHASYYGPGFHGKKMANGQIFNQNAMTAAHKTLKLGTKLEVTNTHNGRSVTVTVTDRGPYVSGRILDLSYGAMETLDGLKSGVIEIKAKIVK
jgi:rare lipoprotein A